MPVIPTSYRTIRHATIRRIKLVLSAGRTVVRMAHRSATEDASSPASAAHAVCQCGTRCMLRFCVPGVAGTTGSGRIPGRAAIEAATEQIGTLAGRKSAVRRNRPVTRVFRQIRAADGGATVGRCAGRALRVANKKHKDGRYGGHGGAHVVTGAAVLLGRGVVKVSGERDAK